MRIPILCLFIAVMASACNLSASTTNDIEPLIVPTTTPQSQPTLTPISVANQTENLVAPTSIPVSTSTDTVICNKETSWESYTIVAGDTLFNIAQRGNTTVDTLVSANCLVDAGLISVGHMLYVPSPIQPRESDDDNPTTGETLDLWWIIQSDGGNNGLPAGCGDSIALRPSNIPDNLSLDETIQQALNYLTVDDNFGDDPSNRVWWNPMSATALTLDHYTIDENHVTINLLGQLNLSGICFDAQIEPQIALNIMTLTGTQSATITVNGENMRYTFDMSGQNTRTVYTWDEFQRNLIEFWLISATEVPPKGVQVGCASYIVPIMTTTLVTDNLVDNVTIALNALFFPDRQNPDDVTNYLLNDQNLFVESVTIDDGHATIQIGGELYGWGVCADPIFEGQILQTIFQFEEIQSATVMNGDWNLRQFVDMSGRPIVQDHIYTR